MIMVTVGRSVHRVEECHQKRNNCAAQSTRIPQSICSVFCSRSGCNMACADGRGDTGFKTDIDHILQSPVAAADKPGAAVALTHSSGTLHAGSPGMKGSGAGGPVDADTPIAADTVVAIASMTKAITTVTVMRLVENGVLHARASTQVPEGFNAFQLPLLCAIQRRRQRCASCAFIHPASPIPSGTCDTTII
jgi:hypothetical protein